MEEFEVDLSLEEEETKELWVPKELPTLYDVHKSFDVVVSDDERYHGVKGEHYGRMVVFTNWVLGNKHVIMRGQSSTGKTNVIEIVATYCKHPFRLGASSDKGNLRNKDINDGTHIVITEINKLNDQTTEMLKDWGEGMASEYAYADPSGMTRHIKIDSKPFITSIADENKAVLPYELVTRLTNVHMDSSVEQNKRVIAYKLERRQNPFKKADITKTRVKELQRYVKSLPDLHSFIIPFLPGKSIVSAIPPLFTKSRRDTDKYCDNMEGITLFHIYDRIQTTKEKKKVLLPTPADVWYNHTIFNDVLIESALECSKAEKKILEILADIKKFKTTKEYTTEDISEMSAKEIHHVFLQNGITASYTTVNKYCKNLSELGYLNRNEDITPHRFGLNKSFAKDYKASINWKHVVEQCREQVQLHYKDVADDYIKRFCEGEGLIVMNPFTGEKVNILEEPVMKKDQTKLDEKPNTMEDGVYEEETVDIKKEIIKMLTETQEVDVQEMVQMISQTTKVSFEKIDDMIKVLLEEGDAYEPSAGKLRLLE